MSVTVTSYRAESPRGRVESVEFSTIGRQNYTFVQLYHRDEIKPIEALLTASGIGLNLVSTTTVLGKPMLIFQGNASPFKVLNSLQAKGEKMKLSEDKQEFDAWRVRSYLGIAGQGLQLASSFMRPDGGIDPGQFVFAATNLTANLINMTYDHGQLTEDPHHLRFLKQRINRELEPHLRKDTTPISVDSNRSEMRGGTEQTEHPIEKAKGFLEKHSVAIGELGLRYLGAAGIAFPATRWKNIPSQGLWSQRDASNYRVYTGLSSIFGKTVALTAHIPDPYNPKPPTLMDTIREKWSFLVGGFIEVTSFTALAYGCFFKTSDNNYKKGVIIFGKPYPDIIGGIGATLFVMGYIVRSWAQFGERKVNMKELYAHASDTIAQTTPDKLPQLLANTAASLTEHFKDNDELSFSIIYSSLLNDMARYHQPELRTAISNKGNGAPSGVVNTPTSAPVVDDRTPHHRIMAATSELHPTIHPEPLKTLAS